MEQILTEQTEDLKRIEVFDGEHKGEKGYLYRDHQEDAMLLLDGGKVVYVDHNLFKEIESSHEDPKPTLHPEYKNEELPPFRITDGPYKEQLAFLVKKLDDETSSLRLTSGDTVLLKNSQFSWSESVKVFSNAIHKDTGDVVKVYEQMETNQPHKLIIDQKKMEIYAEGDLRFIDRSPKKMDRSETQEQRITENNIQVSEVPKVDKHQTKPAGDQYKDQGEIPPFRVLEGAFKGQDAYLVKHVDLDHSLLRVVPTNAEIQIHNKSFDWNEGARVFSNAINKETNDVVKVYEQKPPTKDAPGMDEPISIFISEKNKGIFNAGELRFIGRKGMDLTGNQTFEQVQELGDEHKAELTARILDEEQMKALKASPLPIYAEPHAVQGYYVGVMLKPNVDKINKAFMKSNIKPMSDYRRDYGGYTEKQLLSLSMNGTGLHSLFLSGEEYKKLAGKNIPLNVVESKSDHETLKVTYNLKDEAKVLKHLYSGEKEFDQFNKSSGKNATLHHVPASVREMISKLEIPHIKLKNSNNSLLVKEKDLPALSKIFSKVNEIGQFKPVLHEPSKIPSPTR